ncbi:MAG: Uma2 family endonuclease [Gemmatimonadaceae bacterium]
MCAPVKVLSPSTARNDRYKKRAVYQQEGVPEFWIVDPAARLVERWRPGDAEPEVLLSTMEWQPIATHPPLVLHLESFFRAALD